jgi:hypothetical protein
MPVLGAAEMKSKLLAIARKTPTAIERAVYEFASVEMAESKKLVPVDTGTLRDSGMVDQPVRTATGVTVTLGYGGAAEEYALIVHEDLEAFHKTGQAKYLEQPLKESAPHFLSRVTATVQRILGFDTL